MPLCRTCLGIVEDEEAVQVDQELQKLINFCFSEINLGLTEDPILCKPCDIRMKESHDFKKLCLETQQKWIMMMMIKDSGSSKRKTASVDPPKKKMKVSPMCAAPVAVKTAPAPQIAGPTPAIKAQIKMRPEMTYTLKGGSPRKSRPEPEPKSDEDDLLDLLNSSAIVSKSPSPTEESFECHLCKKRFDKNGSLKKHLAIVHKIKNENKTSGSDSPKPPATVTSAKSPPKGPQVAETVFKCDNCNFTAKYKMAINKHMDSCKKALCPICKAIFSNKNNMERHCRSAHPKPDEDFTPAEEYTKKEPETSQSAETYKYLCFFCPEEYKSLETLEQHHIDTHKEDESIKVPGFSCYLGDCTFRAESSRYIKSHATKAHEFKLEMPPPTCMVIPSFRCRICHTFTSKDIRAIVNHEKTHRNDDESGSS